MAAKHSLPGADVRTLEEVCRAIVPLASLRANPLSSLWQPKNLYYSLTISPEQQRKDEAFYVCLKLKAAAERGVRLKGPSSANSSEKKCSGMAQDAVQRKNVEKMKMAEMSNAT